MTALHKISMDFYESEYVLIALHTSLDDFAVAYWLNKHLKTKFKRHKRD
ncbi:MAG TPA: IPExxxVDY family protein, partial [Flavobacteriaceae bacterium]|nr:IPExxxVDY family protein [Flavobacteriaceae bacterium]